jgi:peroxiredoxin
MTSRKFVLLFFLIFFSGLILKSQVLGRLRIDTTKSKVPYFELEDINFKKIKQTDLIGKVVVLNFWGPNCAPCVEEIPELNKVVKNFKSENVVFLAICPLNQRPSFRIDKYEELRKFLKTKEFLYRICPVEDLRFWGPKLNLTRSPSHFIIDKRGYIIYKCFGIVDANDLSKLINNVLIKN